MDERLQAAVEAVEQRLGITFHKRELLLEALTHETISRRILTILFPATNGSNSWGIRFSSSSSRRRCSNTIRTPRRDG